MIFLWYRILSTKPHNYFYFFPQEAQKTVYKIVYVVVFYDFLKIYICIFYIQIFLL